MIKAAGIRFYLQDKIYNFALNGLELKRGDLVVVETEIGQEIGEVVIPYLEVDEKRIEHQLRPILRKVTVCDLEKLKKYAKKKPEAMKFCRQAIKKYNLPMKLQDVSFAFDGSRITFYFTAETRIDFRNLVRDLMHHFQKSVRLQQVGARDVAKYFGGYGICGRELCCTSFLKQFKSISLDLVKEQQMMQRGSERITGNCGRLLCCLAYERDLYNELRKKMPAVGTMVETKKGVGRVVGMNILKQTIDVELDEEAKITIPVDEAKW